MAGTLNLNVKNIVYDAINFAAILVVVSSFPLLYKY